MRLGAQDAVHQKVVTWRLCSVRAALYAPLYKRHVSPYPESLVSNVFYGIKKKNQCSSSTLIKCGFAVGNCGPGALDFLSFAALNSYQRAGHDVAALNR